MNTENKAYMHPADALTHAFKLMGVTIDEHVASQFRAMCDRQAQPTAITPEWVIC